MALDFNVKRRGHDFLLNTGITDTVLKESYKKEYDFLSFFPKHNEFYVISRSMLCNVLDTCFDHFTESTLLNIAKLLDKNDDVIRDKIHEHSVSKHKQRTPKKPDTTELTQPIREQSAPREQTIPQELTLREPSISKTQPTREHSIPQAQPTREHSIPQAQPTREHSIPHAQHVEQAPLPQLHREQTPIIHKKRETPAYRGRTTPDLNYEEEITKTEILKMFYTLKAQMDVMERYLHRMK